MVTISLPDERAGAQVGELPEDVEVVVWDGKGPAPDGAERIEFFVAQYNDSPPPREALAGLPALKVVQLLSAGADTWLPLVPDGVTLCNARGVHGASTAELAVAGLLAMLRGLPHFWEGQRLHRWDRPETAGLTGRHVLVVGIGDIGDRVATVARALDADVTLVARHGRDGVETMDELPALLPRHDVVVLAVPLTDETRGMVDAQFLAAMPDGAVLVNVARGPVVDTDALLAELTERRLQAFLDVVDPEPLPADHPLWDAPNLMLTPHVGGGTTGWVQRAYAHVVRDQILRYRAGDELANVVSGGY